jgi:hypothetical protein
MSDGNKRTEANTAAGREALDASYQMMDEYMRQSRRLAEQLWMPWIGPFTGTASPFMPPEQWARAYGDMGKMWMSMAQAWTTGLQQTTGRTEGS